VGFEFLQSYALPGISANRIVIIFSYSPIQVKIIAPSWFEPRWGPNPFEPINARLTNLDSGTPAPAYRPGTERVRVRYRLHDGTEHEEELNYAEIMARRNGEALVILPDNGRGKPFAARPYTITHTVIFEDYSERRFSTQPIHKTGF